MSKPQEWIIPDELDLDDALGQAIGEAMGPERVDESEFARGLQGRIEAGSQSNDFARTAASLLPAILLPKSLAKGGAILGGVSLKKVSWKMLPGIVAFPAVVVVMLTVTFAMGLQRTAIRGEQNLERRKAHHAVAAWWRRYFIPVSLVILALAWFGRRAPIEAVSLFVVLSMVALVGIYGVLARAGFATRREVGDRAGSFLFGLVVWGQLVSSLIESQSPGQVGSFGVPICLTLGGMVCTFLAASDGGASRKDRWRMWMVGIVGTAFIGMYWALGGMGLQTVSRSDAVEYVEGAFRDQGGFRAQLDDLSSIAIHLGADGQPAPNLEAYRESLWTWIDRKPGGARDVNYLGLIESEGLGLLRDGDYLALRDEYRLESLLANQKPMRSPEHEILQAVIRNRESPLTKNETEVLVARVLEGVGATGRHACLEDLYVRWQFLRRIGREDAALGLSDAVRDNLVATWAVRLDGEQACFAPGRSSLEPSERIPVPLDALTFVWLDSTDYGLRLMAEFGVPPEIDLELLDSYLADMGRSYGRYEVPGHRARAAAMGLHLHALSEWDQVPPRPLAHFWLDYRLLLAGSALALFCMVVTLRTPKSIVRAKRLASDTTDAA